jgi:AhpD family alkylhydroperoxidase
MSKDYEVITQDLTKYMGKLRKAIPDVMSGFGSMASAASTPNALNEKTKELIALALGVAAHCEGCIGFHVKALHRLNTTEEELTEALGMAIYMGGGPSVMYAADALKAFADLA